MDLRTVSAWIVVLIGLTSARHMQRIPLVGRRGDGLSRLARLGDSIFPFVRSPSVSLSSSSGSSSSSSASSSASSGSSRTSSASSRLRRPRRPSAIDRLRMMRRRAFLANIGGQMVVVLPSSGARRSSRTRPQMRARPTRTQPIREVSLSMIGLPGASALRAQIGLLASRGRGTIPVAQLPVTQGPPGVQFLGQAAQLLTQGGGQFVGQPAQILPQASRQMPLTGNEIVYLPESPQPLSTGLSGATLPLGAITGAVTAGATAASGPSIIPNSNLRISGVNHKGELIITGPGGTITIGTDLLNGISQQNAMPLSTEFEEMELEGLNRTQANSNKFGLTQQGRGTIFIERAPGISPGTQVNGLVTGAGEPVASAASSSAAASGGATASSAASSSAGGGGAAAASSASASAGSASSSSSSSASAVQLGHGISFENGGQVIRIGENGGKTQTITMGGPTGSIQVENGGSGLQVPGNATFIVGG